MRVGRYEVASLVDARYAVDGGALFGVVPRPLWERQLAADARHRVPLVSRCLVAVDRDAGRVVLVDVGLGDRWDARRLERHAVDRAGVGLDAGLARLGLGRDDVTDVLLTHLHLDHAGGLVRAGEGGAPQLAFPRAVHHLQRRAWHWAHSPSEKDAHGFLPEDFAPLERSEHLHLVDGELQLFPGLDLVVSEGHTAGLQLPRFEDEASHLVFAGDLIPTHLHLRPAWISAWDVQPLLTLEEKRVLMAEALEDDGVVVFGHDAQMAACRLQEADGQPAFREAVEL
ncbi:MBL fold metallo-hydrolase [Anaeromyxobacter sp. PSR-1]|uniref:MBL fold metallo-hydrolase n=1 Tax=Anaeromyxobacter sp. PSR-1 TaxID=1300915 RepID=UPI0005DFD136|nr:MBL fold metallo-hydrolase [Anaeromyxobacter sp. PSR-1]GAO04079.1 putative quorum-quenching lactonase YtnP [Anaeromyxobacter sp. PSR-1]